MTTTYLKYLIAGLCIGSIACGEDSVSPSGKKSSSDSVEDDSDEETTDDEEEETPKKKDAGKATAKKDAGKPAVDEEEEEPEEDVDVPVKDAGKKPVVDAGGHDHADAGWSAPEASAGGSGMAAQDFCDAYGMYCGYNKPQRHKDEAACLADFNGNPAQQGCKIMHLSTSIAGTAAACNGMQSAFCFSVHCLHAAGLTDQTGVTYCK